MQSQESSRQGRHTSQFRPQACLSEYHPLSLIIVFSCIQKVFCEYSNSQKAHRTISRTEPLAVLFLAECSVACEPTAEEADDHTDGLGEVCGNRHRASCQKKKYSRSPLYHFPSPTGLYFRSIQRKEGLSGSSTCKQQQTTYPFAVLSLSTRFPLSPLFHQLSYEHRGLRFQRKHARLFRPLRFAARLYNLSSDIVCSIHQCTTDP